MKGSYHLVISFFSGSLLITPWISHLPSLWTVGVVGGIIIGSLTPDVDAPDATIFHLSSYSHQRAAPPLLKIIGLLSAVFGYFIRYFIYIPLSILLHFVLGDPEYRRHRGLLHTPLGIVLTTVVLLCYTLVILTVMGKQFSDGIVLGGVGFCSGGFLHLLEDSCTVGGIAWKFPLSPSRLRGGIRIGRAGDPRAPLMVITLIASNLVLLYSEYRGVVTNVLVVTSVVLFLCSWVFFLALSQVGRTRRT